MKSTLIAAALLVLAGPAYASSNAEWECPGRFSVSAGKGEMSVSKLYGSMYGEKGLPPEQGSYRVTWEFRHRGKSNLELWVNGKKCKSTN
jgi:hypothetical protein